MAADFHIKKHHAAEMEERRRQFPYSFRMSTVVGPRKFATKAEVMQCRAFFEGQKVLVNKNTAYFVRVEDAIFFKMGMWLT
jgi:nucleoside-diphosphate-sugar epimerase